MRLKPRFVGLIACCAIFVASSAMAGDLKDALRRVVETSPPGRIVDEMSRIGARAEPYTRRLVDAGRAVARRIVDADKTPIQSMKQRRTDIQLPATGKRTQKRRARTRSRSQR